jgi:hypothetical protein
MTEWLMRSLCSNDLTSHCLLALTGPFLVSEHVWCTSWSCWLGWDYLDGLFRWLIDRWVVSLSFRINECFHLDLHRWLNPTRTTDSCVLAGRWAGRPSRSRLVPDISRHSKISSGRSGFQVWFQVRGPEDTCRIPTTNLLPRQNNCKKVRAD